MRLNQPELTLVLTDDEQAMSAIRRQHDSSVLGVLVDARVLGQLFTNGKLKIWIALKGSVEMQSVSSQRGERPPLLTLYRGPQGQ